MTQSPLTLFKPHAGGLDLTNQYTQMYLQIHLHIRPEKLRVWAFNYFGYIVNLYNVSSHVLRVKSRQTKETYSSEFRLSSNKKAPLLVNWGGGDSVYVDQLHVLTVKID